MKKSADIKGIDDIAAMMQLYMDKFGMPVKMDCKKFAQQYFEGMEQKVLRGTRLALPLNLGYMQGLEHLYAGEDKDHLNKFGNLDYSVIWMKHPMFRYHSIKTNTELNEKIKEAKLSGVQVPNRYVEGDYFIIKEEK